jgi:hypothetical protein
MVEGNVGIGTTHPREKLDVAGNIHVSGAIKSGNSMVFNGGIHTITATTTADPAYSKRIRIGYQDPDNPGPFSDIQVGIGTLGPTERLDVDGRVRVRNLPLNNALTDVVVADATGVLQRRAASTLVAPDNDWDFTTNPPHMFNLNTGNVGIGTANPGRLLTLSRANQAASTQFELRNVGGITGGNFDGISFTQGNTGSTLLGNIKLLYATDGSTALAFETRTSAGPVTEKVRVDKDGNVGIGTINPMRLLDVVGNIAGVRVVNQTNPNGSVLELKNDTSSPAPTFLGAINFVRPDGESLGQIGYLAEPANAMIFRTNTAFQGGLANERMRIAANGNVGIGTISLGGPAPTNNLHVTGGIRLGTLLPNIGPADIHVCRDPGSMDLVMCGMSDARLKTNIMPLTDALEKLEAIRGVSFEWNESYRSSGRSSGHREIGVIAQEVEEVFPELVFTSSSDGYKAVDYSRLTAVLIEAVKELKAENEALKQRVETLEKATAKR